MFVKSWKKIWSGFFISIAAYTVMMIVVCINVLIYKTRQLMSTVIHYFSWNYMIICSTKWMTASWITIKTSGIFIMTIIWWIWRLYFKLLSILLLWFLNKLVLHLLPSIFEKINKFCKEFSLINFKKVKK